MFTACIASSGLPPPPWAFDSLSSFVADFRLQDSERTEPFLLRFILTSLKYNFPDQLSGPNHQDTQIEVSK